MRCKNCKEKFEPARFNMKYCLKDECVRVFVEEVKNKTWKKTKQKAKLVKENAGHFFNANNHYNVRFDERNTHLQCEHCNTYLSGNLIEYQRNLIHKIGIESCHELEADARKTRKFTKDELKEIITEYKQKVKQLENDNQF